MRYTLGDYSQALAAAKLVKQYLAPQAGMMTEVVFYFYDSLIHLACINELENAKVLAQVKNNQQKMKCWADNAPMNFQHKYELVCAEELRILGDRLAAMECYDRAIAGAKENKYVQDEALANELAAKFYLDWGKEKIAAVYIQEAYFCYERWGAKAKTDDLVRHFEALLYPIVQQTNSIDPLVTLHNITPLNWSDHSSVSNPQSTSSSTNNINAALDLATIFKSAQVLSKSIDLNELLEKLASIMLQTSGAEQLVLLLPSDSDANLQVRVIATPETVKLVSSPLKESTSLPVQLIQYVQRTREILVLAGGKNEPPIVDPFLQQHSHASMLYLPLLQQNKLVGLLYLEHQSVAGVFNRDRVTILNFLCTQAAISLENALLNQALAQKLEVQTAKRKESETRFQNMVDNVPGVVYQCRSTPDGTLSFPYVSADCHALYGISAEAIMKGQYSLRDFEHSEDSPLLDRMMAEAIKTLQPFDHEFRIVTPSGTLKWVHTVNQVTHTLPDGTIFSDGMVMDVSDRKHQEQEILESKAFLQTVLDTFPLSVFWKDRDSSYIGINQNFARDAGLSKPQDIVGLTDFDMPWAETEAEAYRAGDQEVIQSGSPKLGIIESQVQTDGSKIWVETNKLPLHDLEGNVIGVMGTYQDISDRKQAEQQLQELSERLELAVESAQLGIWVWDHQDNRLTWDDRMFAIYGVSPEAFGETYEDWANCIHPEDLVQLETQTSDSVIGSANTYTQEFRVIRPDSTIRYILATATVQRDNEGQPIRSVGMNLDMTDRKEAEQALLQQQTHLSALLNNIPHFTWLKDADGRYIAINDTYEELCGISMDRIVGRTDYDLWSTELARSYQADDAQVLASGQRKSIVEQFSRADGTLGWLETTKTPFKDEQGKWAGTVGIAADITDRKTAEAKLQRTNAELLRATQHKSEFLASMSHELRTPLNAVLGFSQLMQSDHSISKEHHERLATINRNGEYLLALINDILEMSKIEAGKITFNPKQVDLHQFLEEIRATFEVKAKSKNLAFKVTAASDIPRYLQIDEVKLRQILLNLLSNALKFTQAGQISFHTQVLDIVHDSLHEKAHLQFTVSDTGPGIEADELENIFEPFKQATSGRQHHQGTGLGLPISRTFAQMMGGNIQLESTLGQGSTFFCDIYAQVLSAHKVDEIQPHRNQNIQGLKNRQQTYRLLIVDDNPDNRALLSQMLSITGFEVRHVINGVQAVAMNESWQPHLIFMDIHMPQMDGLEATRQIRQSGLTPKIIAVSASAFSDDHQVALAAGCDAFMAKPFTVNKIFEHIASLLDLEFTKAPLPIEPVLRVITISGV